MKTWGEPHLPKGDARRQGLVRIDRILPAASNTQARAGDATMNEGHRRPRRPFGHRRHGDGRGPTPVRCRVLVGDTPRRKNANLPDDRPFPPRRRPQSTRPPSRIRHNGTQDGSPRPQARRPDSRPTSRSDHDPSSYEHSRTFTGAARCRTSADLPALITKDDVPHADEIRVAGEDVHRSCLAASRSGRATTAG